MGHSKLELIEMTTEIVTAYIAQHAIDAAALPALIHEVHATLVSIDIGATAVPATLKPDPAVPLRRAVQPDYVVDLFTGKKFKSLKRHLRTTHNMTPDEYRDYWGLPKDFPMVAPNYAKVRSEFAKSAGLGQSLRPKNSAA